MDSQSSPEAQRPRRTVRSRWSWSFGSIAGIPIRVHVTLIFLLVWVAFGYWVRGVGPSVTAAGVALVVSVFVIVLLHELTHALMARRFGVGTRDILLLPIGGIASLERIPERPRQEIAIALVGPIFNLVLAAALWGVLALAGGDPDVRATTSLGEAIIAQLIWINVALAAFNLLPAFPLDGGRALRALLSIWMGRETATRTAAGLGKVLAAALAVFGLFFNPWLVLIAAVIWIGAREEVVLMQIREAIAGVPARAAMLRKFESVGADQPLAAAAAIAMETGADAIPIVDHGRPIGVLTQRDLALGIDTVGPAAPVASAPHHEALVVSPDEPLEQVLDRLQTDPDAVAVVVDETGPIGVLTPEQLGRYVALHANQRPRTPLAV